ncbi:bifunctional dihydropteridine reductase/dihydrofolate reductase TmpR [Roseofilum sp. Belize Diploria]|uniref:bifunctional dihydropteridine reductase/dihydrofolate reductase TmpR n=1 Tax=Roseofilum sp. Belize Diploria TaxID=2821501 RepID=UPI000E807035|nr:bifunctional dihydropteridine reductase/dihydrofolate reductase TmpR [Roseofilum sp. Belize Diploria]MBP0007433.1 bifunctional dihydropteridine reductase/dihydrofolate reductase TmpR [Roseofilum sp. Belize Diploria]HBQ98099.1 bifunctional dihydropteridine reductase/dihydrofolate reductase TmpR [Cyanobacteria bacterium UBA11691]
MLKKALVTGSAVGIGQAIALDLASKGFDVAFHYNKSAEVAQKVSQEAAVTYGVNSIALQADVTQPEQAKSLVETAAQQLGGLSVVVNNVGDYLEKQISQVSIEEWHQIFNSNLHSAFYINQTAIPYLKAAGWGRIVNFAFASAQNVIADRINPVYRIAKTGIIVYTKSLAVELIEDNITVNVISPGVAENSIGLEESIPLLPTKRPATLKEVSDAVGFFISPEANYITGQNLEVAGGLRL